MTFARATRPYRSRWARLLARIYEVFPLLCPGCGAEMRILAFITAAEPVDAILRHPSACLPPRRPSRPHAARPSTTSASTPTPASTSTRPMHHPTEPEPVADFDFDCDQSHGA